MGRTTADKKRKRRAARKKKRERNRLRREARSESESLQALRRLLSPVFREDFDDGFAMSNDPGALQLPRISDSLQILAEPIVELVGSAAEMDGAEYGSLLDLAVRLWNLDPDEALPYGLVLRISERLDLDPLDARVLAEEALHERRTRFGNDPRKIVEMIVDGGSQVRVVSIAPSDLFPVW